MRITAVELNAAMPRMVARLGPTTSLVDAMATLCIALGAIKGLDVMTDRELVQLCERLLTEMFVINVKAPGGATS